MAYFGITDALTKPGECVNIYQNLANQETSEQFSDRRLWAAVLLQALEDWKSGNRRLNKAAETFSLTAEKISPERAAALDFRPIAYSAN